MHCLSRKSVEMIRNEADLDVCHLVGDVDGMQDSKLVSFRYCLVMGYEAVSWASQSWTVAYCRTLGMSFRGSSVAIVFPRAI